MADAYTHGAKGIAATGALNVSTNAARVDINTLMNIYLSRLQTVAEKIRQAARA